MADSAFDRILAEIRKSEQEVRSFRAKEAWKRRKAKMKETNSTPAVAYVRASLLQRSAQRERIEAYANNHGFHIIRSYEDVGTSGRQQYRRMVAHAAEGEFAVILCFDLSRFGRLDRIGAAEAIESLRDAGVTLHTVLDGEVDWTTLTTRIVGAV